jgi:hypothetical protein
VHPTIQAFKDAKMVRFQEREHMLETVHDFFERVGKPDMLIDCLLAPEPVLKDHVSEQTYRGASALKERLGQIHGNVDATPVEVADVVDINHHTVCASWRGGKQEQAEEPVFGSYVFKFDPEGRIKEVAVHRDGDDKEFLEA